MIINIGGDLTMRLKENKIIIRMKEDYIYRSFFFLIISSFITLGFTIYNIYLAVTYKFVWNIGISVYYALLLCIRVYIIFSEYKLNKDEFKKKREYKRKMSVLNLSATLKEE